MKRFGCFEISIHYFIDSSGRSPYHVWYERLGDEKTRQVIDARMARLRSGNLGDCKSVGSGVLELRIDYGPGFRIYFGKMEEQLILLLIGGSKKLSRKTSSRHKVIGVSSEARTVKSRGTVPYLPGLLSRLADPKYAAGYLSECFNDSPSVFLLGLRDLVDARGGVSAVAREAGISREHLYRLLSADGNPRLSSLANLLAALGINLTFTVEQDKEAA